MLQRIEGRRSRARKHECNAAAAFHQPQILDAQLLSAKLPLDRLHGTSQPPRRHAGVSKPLDRPQRYQIAEIVEAFAPTNPRPYQPQALPIAQPPVVNADNPPRFRSGVAFAQIPRLTGRLAARLTAQSPPEIISRMSTLGQPYTPDAKVPHCHYTTGNTPETRPQAVLA